MTLIQKIQISISSFLTRYAIPIASLRAALASNRVESSVGSETSSGRTISGISVQPLGR